MFMMGGSAAARLQHTGMIVSYSFLPLALARPRGMPRSAFDAARARLRRRRRADGARARPDRLLRLPSPSRRRGDTAPSTTAAARLAEGALASPSRHGGDRRRHHRGARAPHPAIPEELEPARDRLRACRHGLAAAAELRHALVSECLRHARQRRELLGAGPADRAGRELDRPLDQLCLRRDAPGLAVAVARVRRPPRARARHALLRHRRRRRRSSMRSAASPRSSSRFSISSPASISIGGRPMPPSS